MKQATGDKLYHVKSHGVTRELTANWSDAFDAHEQLVRKLGKHNVEIITIRDTRTPQQKNSAKY